MLIVATNNPRSHGVAIAWTLRVAVDAAAFLLFSRRRLGLGPSIRDTMAIGAGLAVTVGVGATIGSLAYRLAFSAFALTAFAVVAPAILLGRAERRALMNMARIP